LPEFGDNDGLPDGEVSVVFNFKRCGVEFILNNLLLVGLAVISGLMLIWPVLRGNGGAVTVAPAEAVLLINRNNALVLDVRDEAEFAAGHIMGARNIPLARLAERVGEIEKYKERPLLVNCQGGVRSLKACDILRRQGFSQLHSLEGGINAWVAAKLPVVKD
jgi:rhodanese-related sulfurtransferase